MEIKSSVAVACSLPGRAKDLSAHLYLARYIFPTAELLKIRDSSYVTVCRRLNPNNVLPSFYRSSSPSRLDLVPSGTRLSNLSWWLYI